MLAKVKQVPPWGWAAVFATAGLAFLVWHRYANDIDDTSWIDVDQPPAVADYASTQPSTMACRPRQTFSGTLKSGWCD